MTPTELIDELVKFIEKAVKNYDLLTKVNGVSKAPTVYCGFLPPKNKDNDISAFPYIVVRYLYEEIKEEDIVNVRIIIGTYSQDEQNGWKDLINIATRIKIELKKKEVFGAFSLSGPIKIVLFEDQPFPQWEAIVDLSFNIPNVQIDWSEKDFDYEK